MLKKIASIIVGIVLSSSAFSQLNSYAFAELDSLKAIEDRIIVVFISTDWCKFCHQMENTTFQNKNVTKLLNRHFYFLKLNAESKQDITYGGHTFKYKPTGGNTGVHELAEQLGTIDGKLNYPTISILNRKNEIVFQYGGTMTSDQLIAVLNELLKQ